MSKFTTANDTCLEAALRLVVGYDASEEVLKLYDELARQYGRGWQEGYDAGYEQGYDRCLAEVKTNEDERRKLAGATEQELADKAQACMDELWGPVKPENAFPDEETVQAFTALMSQ